MVRLVGVLCLVFVGGCASVGGRLADSVSSAIANQADPETVRVGAPAYLLMVDGLIGGDPDDGKLLFAGARLYGAYAGAFVTDPNRARRLAGKAREYGRRGVCLELEKVCAALDGPLDGFTASLSGVGVDGVEALYGYGAAWAAWVQANATDWNAVADLPKIEALMVRVVELDEAHDHGGAHLYLGVLLTQRPASLGGRPEEGRQHFERAVALSEGKNLMAKVLLAKQYARLVFDRELHDRVLEQVLAADPVAPDLTLSNVLAQEQAKVLLASADDYF